MRFRPVFIAVIAVCAMGLSACIVEREPDMTRDPNAPADVSAPPADAQRSSSGLAWKVLTAGSGTRHPRPNSEVTVHYTGWTTAGMKFDSSVDRGEPTSFPLNRVIPGWTEGVQMMVEGEKRRFWIPADLAYGENPGGGAPGGMLVFDIELLRIGS
jgi:FKBP-type peptidyl-prolyl cis-trans isomerase